MKLKRKENQKLDDILKVALTLHVEPEEEWNQHILEAWKENSSMKKVGKRKISLAAAAVCMLLATGSVLAATKYLKVTDLAERSGVEAIRSAFSGEDVTEIYESKEAGAYRITLLGIASGEALVQGKLTEQMPDLRGTYAALAIERLDGTAMPATSEDAYAELEFFASPLIEGLEPWQYNIASMNGGYSDFVEDGILYRLIECDDVILFADRALYLCVSDTPFYDTNAYHYDENSGKISRDETYNGINVLFSLPVDASKADPAGAEAYLKKLEESWRSEEGTLADSSILDLVTRLDGLLAAGEDEEALKYFTTIGKPMVLAADERGEYHYEYPNGETNEVAYFYQKDFQNGRDYMISYMDFDKETEEWRKLCVVILTENGDGTASAQRYEGWVREIN